MGKMPCRMPDDNVYHGFDRDYRQLALQSVILFISDQLLESGKQLRDEIKISKKSIDLILETKMDHRCMSFIHEKCLPLIKNKQKSPDDSINDDIWSLLNLLHRLGSYQIPKEFFPGILLVFFEICYLVDIRRFHHV